MSAPNEKQKLNQFEILEQIGTGGMGEVFLARDTELDRNVALKRLTPLLAEDANARKRFLREAKSAAALDHPYICKIYEVGEANGKAYIAMEFVEGETLQAKVEKGPLGLSEVLAYGSEIAEAMEAAHEKNIIHRDLKTPNIMVTRQGHVKVLDFGIALQLEAEDGESHAETLSHRLSSHGATPGTVVYMSPEQVRGEPLDERSDVFALGVVLYEMATGKLPFQGATSGLTYDAILNRGPAPPTSVLPTVPSELEHIILKALEKDRENRYQTVKELHVDLRRLARDTGAGNAAELASVRSSAAATATAAKRRGSFGVALVFSAVALLLVLGGYLYWGGGGNAASIDSLAVLPFENSRNDPEVDYLSDGIPESLINRLSRLPSLDVMARSTAFRYRDSELDPQSVGRELGVAAVVTGRVVQQDDALNVQAELVEVATGRQLWGEQFNRPLEEIASLQGDITRSISRALSVDLAADEGRMTTDAEAYQAYLRGRFLWNKRTNEDFVRAIGFFETAVERDPSYALAYVGLADCYALLGGQFYGAHPDFPPRETNQKAREAAERAIELESSLAQAHATRAWIDLLDEWDFEAAERGFQRAIELDPSYATAHQWYAYYLSTRGRHEEAIREAEITLELEPGSPLQNRTLGNILYQARRYDEAIEQLRAALELDASFPLTREFLVQALWLSGKRDEAVRVAREGDLPYAPVLELVRDGQIAEARALYTEGAIPTKGPVDDVTVVALTGDADATVAILERAYGERQPNLPNLLGLPLFDSLQDPRIDELRQRIGL